jgi:hypothetical protein
MLAFLLGLIDPISRIAAKIADYKVAAKNAETDKERIAAEERVKTLEARRDVLVAESGSRWNTITRAALTIGPGCYLTKVFLWDKVIGSFVGYTPNIFWTDPLDDNLWKVTAAVIGFYFLYDIVSRLKR